MDIGFSTLSGAPGKPSAPLLWLGQSSRRFQNEECRASSFFHLGLSSSRGGSVVVATSRNSCHCDAWIVKQPGSCATTVRNRKDCLSGEEFFHSYGWTVADLRWKTEPRPGSRYPQDHEVPVRQEYGHRRQPKSRCQRRGYLSAGQRRQHRDQRPRYSVISGRRSFDLLAE